MDAADDELFLPVVGGPVGWLRVASPAPLEAVRGTQMYVLDDGADEPRYVAIDPVEWSR